MPIFQPIDIEDFRRRTRWKENYNFAKVASRLADYGYSCIRLSDDWKGADFIACHVNGDYLKVQLKSVLCMYERYRGKDLYIAFIHRKTGNLYVYPHDAFVGYLESVGHRSIQTVSWNEHGGYSWPNPPHELLDWLNSGNWNLDSETGDRE